ncbi:MAG TPA: hypothetical protein VLA47_06275, partial [Nitrospira sp.]|nr:hypothetical protein [Nitrospira sp.]
ERPAHGQELRPVGARQPALGKLQRKHRGAHIARQLQLLLRDRQYLLDLGELPLIAVARQLLVERLQRKLLALRFGLPGFQRTELRLRVAQRLLGLPRERASSAATASMSPSAWSKLTGEPKPRR